MVDEGWRWLNSGILWWLFSLPFIFALVLFLFRRLQKKTENIFGSKITPFLTSSFDNNKARWRLILEIGVFAFLLIALARPQAFLETQKVQKAGVEVMLAVDVSNSMLAEDVTPSRLEVAKAELSRFVIANPEHRYGLLAFAGGAALLSPLTTDPNAILMYLESLFTNSVSSQGTNFKKALITALEAFQRGGVDAEDLDTSVTRAVIVVSDGEDHEEGVGEVLNKLTEQGLRVFTLAVGTEQGAPVPLYNNSGSRVGFRRYNDKPVMSKVNMQVLKEIANEGKGSFHELRIGGSSIKQLSNELRKLDASEFGEGEIATYDEKYQIFLVFAFFVALLEFLMGNRRKRGRIWKGRFEVMEQ